MTKPLNVELDTYRRQFVAIDSAARTMTDGLTDVQLTWSPGHGLWSIHDCLDHLVVTGKLSLLHIADAVAKGHTRRLYSDGPFRHAMIDRCVVWFMEPPPRLKFRAPRAYQPARRDAAHAVVQEFFRLQTELGEALVEANGLDLVAIKVWNPAYRWNQFGLGQEFAFTAAHERRHLWQISQVKANRSFPA